MSNVDASAGTEGSPDVSSEGSVSLRSLLHTVIKHSGSDLHVQADSVPMVRIDGRARFLSVAPPTVQVVQGFINEILKTPEQHEALDKRGAIDVSYVMDSGARFRVNCFMARGKFAIAARRIITKIPTVQELNLPMQIEQLADNHRGVVIVSGTTGSGKSTTLAALVGKINRTRAERIITVEDPVEYQHENAKAMVGQIEVGTDTESYDFALREVLRQDPDTIMIGEIRDTLSLTTALRAADTGHLVFSTVHATNATMTIERLVSLFDPQQRELQQAQLSMNLLAVVCQRLAKRREGPGRVPVAEIFTMTPLARKYILDGEYDKLKGMVGNKDTGSQSFDQHLTELFQKQIIDIAEARRLATNAESLNMALRGITTR